MLTNLEPGLALLSLSASLTAVCQLLATTSILRPHLCSDLAEQTHNNFSAFRKYLADPALRNELFVGGTNPQVGWPPLGFGA